MKCLSCHKRKAQNIAPYGLLPCKICVKRQRSYTIEEAIELTTQDIKEERRKFQVDIEQRYEGDVPNLNYINAYGTDGFSVADLQRAKARHGTYYRDSWDKYHPAKRSK